MNKSITKVTEVFSNIVHFFYKKIPYYQEDQLKLITSEHLQDINLFRPTAGWSTIIDIDYLFDNYSTRHCTTHLIEIIDKIIIKSKKTFPTLISIKYNH
nr:hypothetical protein 1573p1_00034 [Serratia marcescens]